MMETRNWVDMPDKVKELIVDKMDIVTRFRFKQCSKETKSLVGSRPLHFSKVVCDYKCNYSADNEYKFSLDLDGFKIKRTVRYESKIYFPGAKVPQYLKTIWEKNILSANISMDHFQTNWEFPKRMKGLEPFIKVKTINLGCDENTKWLNHLLPGVESVDFQSDDDDMQGCCDEMHPIIINAKTLDLSYGYDLTDAHLEVYKATNLTDGFNETPFSKYRGVTVKGINRFLKRWVNEDYPVGSKFDLLTWRDTAIHNMETVSLFVDGLNYSINKRSYDNKIEVRIRMNEKKYIKFTPFPGEEYWNLEAIVRNVEDDEVKAEFAMWNFLPPEVKTMIIKKMDVFTRTRLKVCSRLEKTLVESICFNAKRMQINKSARSEMWYPGVMIYTFGVNRTLSISAEGCHLYVYAPAMSYGHMDEFGSLKRRIQFDSEEEARERWKLMFQSLLMDERLKISHSFCISDCERDYFGTEGIVSSSKIMNAKKLEVSEFAITEEEILASKATKISVLECIVSHKSVNLLIKKWVQEDYPIGANFHFEIPKKRCEEERYEEVAEEQNEEDEADEKDVEEEEEKIEENNEEVAGEESDGESLEDDEIWMKKMMDEEEAEEEDEQEDEEENYEVVEEKDSDKKSPNNKEVDDEESDDDDEYFDWVGGRVEDMDESSAPLPTAEEYAELLEGLDYTKMDEESRSFQYEKGTIKMGEGKYIKLIICKGSMSWSVKGMVMECKKINK